MITSDDVVRAVEAFEKERGFPYVNSSHIAKRLNTTRASVIKAGRKAVEEGKLVEQVGWRGSVTFTMPFATTTEEPSRLTPAQRELLDRIKAAGPEGLIDDKGLTAGSSLLRKGLITRVDVETVPATKIYSDRASTHTLQGRLRYITLSRYTAVDAQGTTMKESTGSWGIWDETAQHWTPDPLTGSHRPDEPAQYPTKQEAERIADREWRKLNPDRRFVVKRHSLHESNENDFHQAGAEHAQEQMESDYFHDWVFEQLRADVPGGHITDARQIARNMLQQLVWDTARGLDMSAVVGREVTREESKEFMTGFRENAQSKSAVDWLTEIVREEWTEKIPPHWEGGVSESSRELVGEYHTRSGKIGAKIYRQTGTYSYSGEWGAGSGHSAEQMQRQVNDWLNNKRGIKVVIPFAPAPDRTHERHGVREADPTSDHALIQRMLAFYAAQKGLGDYVHNSAIPMGGGVWRFHVRPFRGISKPRSRADVRSHEEQVTHAELEREWRKKGVSESRRTPKYRTNPALLGVVTALIRGDRLEIQGKGKNVFYAGSTTENRRDQFWYEHTGGRTYKETPEEVIEALLPHVGVEALVNAKKVG